MNGLFPSHEICIPTSHLDELVHTLAATMMDRDALSNIMEAMINAVVVISLEGRILYTNTAACELLACRPGELDGSPIDRILAEGHSWVSCCMTEILHQGAIRNREVWFISTSGTRIPVLFSASAQRTGSDGVRGFVLSAQDISEHIRLREALQASRESFQAIVEKSADGVLIVSQDGHVLFLNPAAEHLLGRSWQEMMGMPFGHPMISGDVTEVDIRRKNGELGIAEMRMVETDWHGQFAHLVSLRDVTENVRLREQLQQLSMEDSLTGLNNRRGFLMLAEQELKVAHRTGCRMSLIFIDLDGMKTINDTLGHKVGDQALVETAAIMRKVFRKSDLLSRLGGDEFLALSINEPQEHAALSGHHIRHRLEQETARRNAQPGRLYTLSLSIGIVPVVTDGHTSLDSLIQQADSAMYQVKLRKKAQAR